MTMMTTDHVRVDADTIPRAAVAVSWRRSVEDVWFYRFHSTDRGAKMAFARYNKAYDRVNFKETGWKDITPQDRESGVWLW
jgi:hypothetical protein